MDINRNAGGALELQVINHSNIIPTGTNMWSGWWVLKITLNHESLSLKKCLISKQINSIHYFTVKNG
jgi:hypothetical protein